MLCRLQWKALLGVEFSGAVYEFARTYAGDSLVYVWQFGWTNWTDMAFNEFSSYVIFGAQLSRASAVRAEEVVMENGFAHVAQNVRTSYTYQHFTRGSRLHFGRVGYSF